MATSFLMAELFGIMSTSRTDKRYIMYLDDTLRAKEERDYLQRLEAGTENILTKDL